MSPLRVVALDPRRGPGLLMWVAVLAALALAGWGLWARLERRS